MDGITINQWAARSLGSVLTILAKDETECDSVTVELVGEQWHVTARGPDRDRHAVVGPTGNVEFVDSFL